MQTAISALLGGLPGEGVHGGKQSAETGEAESFDPAMADAGPVPGYFVT